jgi:hypothetical protein
MRLQKANRSITILVASLSLASVACVLVSGYFRHRQVTALNARTESLLLSIQLAAATDKLTAAVRGFAVAGDPRYRDVFLREIHVERSRDRAVEGCRRSASPRRRANWSPAPSKIPMLSSPRRRSRSKPPNARTSPRQWDMCTARNTSRRKP